ncbi:MAG: aldo/keto reductase [Bacillota bacterium]|jgi:predicted aldo/keto reductase-like oxidoreductase
MQYRKFGKHDVQVSALGFGLMRLPILRDDPSKVDEKKTEEMVDYAIGQGVNYFDTAYVYHRGESEVVIGKILRKGYRERVHLATKCPSWIIETAQDYDKYFGIQLERLQTDHIDMYLLHALDKRRWPKLLKAGAFEFLDRAKSDGRIRFAGFSFHDDLGTFKTIVDSYDWDFCQIQYNYLDEEFQAGTQGLKYASERGLAVVIMEPLRGGRLAQNLPPEVQAVWTKAEPARKPADWGLRWVWNHPEVSVVLSGMGEMWQVVENVNTAKSALPNSLTPEELSVYEGAKDAFRSRIRIGCTGCEYCLPCPQMINIPEWFQSYNYACMLGTLSSFGNDYERMRTDYGDLADCAKCGQCEEACPQSLAIRDHLDEILTHFRKSPES